MPWAWRTAATPKRKKAFLIISITVNLLILCAFKYFGFFAENVTTVLKALHLMPAPWVIQIALPAGISFFTFQSISYAVDVYQGKSRACRSLLDYATFVSFFPQLVAGPIERAGHMLPQYAGQRALDLSGIRTGSGPAPLGLVSKDRHR